MILFTQRTLRSLAKHGKSIINSPRFASSSIFKNVNKPKLVQPFLFTAGVTATVFSSCAIIQYERAKRQSTFKNYWERFKQQRVEKTFVICEKIKQWWDSLGEGHKIAVGIIGINLFIFGCWQIRACQPFMTKWFTASPYSRSPTLLLSCFSHSEVWHFAANMFVLWSFAPFIQSILGSEQFAAFYITGGCFSSYISHCFKIASCVAVPSLGASGALLAVLAACCVKEPEARLSIIFLPFFTFPAKTALYGLVAFDACGILFKWRLFDHACHLGGTLFGAWYITYGHKYLWDQRAPVIQQWHEFRKSLEEKRL